MQYSAPAFAGLDPARTDLFNALYDLFITQTAKSALAAALAGVPDLFALL